MEPTNHTEEHFSGNRFTKYYRVLLPFVLFFALYFLNYLFNPFADEHWSYYQRASLRDIIIEVICSLSMCVLLSEISFQIGTYFLNRVVESSRPYRAFAQHVVVILIVYTVFIFLIFYIQHLLWQDEMSTSESDLLIYWNFFIDTFILAFFISALHALLFFLKRWTITAMEYSKIQLKAAELKEIALQAEINALKTQIDPHFVFNNFSVLSELIHEDPKTADQFLNHLSKVYRYIIQNSSKNLIEVREELKFLDSYMYLIHLRHGKNVELHVDLCEEIQSTGIPPATLQLLVENAIKHNKATAKDPLHIEIYNTQERIIVKNRLNQLTLSQQSTKLGLSNVVRRFKLLSEQEVKIQDGPEYFIVDIPILKQVE